MTCLRAADQAGGEVAPDDFWLTRALAAPASGFRERHPRRFQDADRAETDDRPVSADLDCLAERGLDPGRLRRIGGEAQVIGAISDPFEQNEPVIIAARSGDGLAAGI